MGDDLLQTLQIVTQFGFQIRGGQLRVFAIDDVLLPIEEPVGHFVLQGIGDDGHDLLNLEVHNKQLTFQSFLLY